LLGEGGGHHATGGVAGHDGVPHAEHVQCRTDAGCLIRDGITVTSRFGRTAVPEQVDANNPMGAREQGTSRSHQRLDRRQ